MEEVKKKGRPSADQNDPQSNVCTICDPLMEPYYIQKDSSNFTVMERTIATRGFGGKAASGKESEKALGYYTSFKNALNRVAKENSALKLKLKVYGLNNFLASASFTLDTNKLYDWPEVNGAEYVNVTVSMLPPLFDMFAVCKLAMPV
jgi:hypothetical protein